MPETAASPAQSPSLGDQIATLLDRLRNNQKAIQASIISLEERNRRRQ